MLPCYSQYWAYQNFASLCVELSSSDEIAVSELCQSVYSRLMAVWDCQDQIPNGKSPTFPEPIPVLHSTCDKVSLITHVLGFHLLHSKASFVQLFESGLMLQGGCSKGKNKYFFICKSVFLNGRSTAISTVILLTGYILLRKI